MYKLFSLSATVPLLSIPLLGLPLSPILVLGEWAPSSKIVFFLPLPSPRRRSYSYPEGLPLILGGLVLFYDRFWTNFLTLPVRSPH